MESVGVLASLREKCLVNSLPWFVSFRGIFDVLDKDNSNSIDEDEFVAGMKEYPSRPGVLDLEISQVGSKYLFDLVPPPLTFPNLPGRAS